jgi:hypothetical protein
MNKNIPQLDKIDTFVFGAFIGVVFLTLTVYFTSNGTYEQGVKDAHKEAYEHGLMVKEISKDDQVIYRWIETHKLGYE